MPPVLMSGAHMGLNHRINGIGRFGSKGSTGGQGTGSLKRKNPRRLHPGDAVFHPCCQAPDPRRA